MLQIYKSRCPAVSVILPSYNRASYLRRSIASVVSQTFKDWELILIDDGSGDETFEIFDEYLMQHENFRYLKHKNRNLPLTANAGIQAACGKYVTFLGSDDEYRQTHLDMRVKYMGEHPEVDLIHGGLVVVGDPHVPDKRDPSRRIHLDECVVGGTLFGRKDVFIDLGGFKDMSYAEDSELLERAQKVFRTAKVSFPTYVYYRDTPGSICNSL